MKAKIFKLLFIPFVLSSCNSEVIFKKSLLNENENSIKRTYEYFDGKFTHKVNFKETSNVKVEIVSKSGSLKVDICASNSQESIYKGNFTEDMTFVVNNLQGSYNFVLNASSHEGSYSFSWNL